MAINLNNVQNWIDPKAFNTLTTNAPRFENLFYKLNRTLPIDEYDNIYKGYYNDIQTIKFRSNLMPGQICHVHKGLHYWDLSKIDTENNFHLGTVKSAVKVKENNETMIRVTLTKPKSNLEWMTWYRYSRCSKVAFFKVITNADGYKIQSIFNPSFEFIRRINDSNFIIKPYDTNIDTVIASDLNGTDCWEAGMFNKLKDPENYTDELLVDIRDIESVRATIRYWESALNEYKNNLKLPDAHYQVKLARYSLDYYRAVLNRLQIESGATTGDLDAAIRNEEKKRDILLSLQPPSIEDKVFNALSKLSYIKILHFTVDRNCNDVGSQAVNYVTKLPYKKGNLAKPNFITINPQNQSLNNVELKNWGKYENHIVVEGGVNTVRHRRIYFTVNLLTAFGLTATELAKYDIKCTYSIQERSMDDISLSRWEGGPYGSTGSTAWIWSEITAWKSGNNIIVGMGSKTWSLYCARSDSIQKTTWSSEHLTGNMVIMLLRKSDFKSIIF